jgi:uncharacterized DUF497 family protein
MSSGEPDDLTLQFEWDPIKAALNRSKHGVSFELASTVFLDKRALTVFDVSHSDNEDRWFTLGVSIDGSLLAVAHTISPRDPSHMLVRIISARRATRRESRQYENEP